MVAGQIMQTNYYNNGSPWLYFYQPQSFVNKP
jgi:hypothetical protein